MRDFGRRSLGQRLLFGLVAVSLSYSVAIAWLTIRDSVDEVYELFDVHLAQTALALLHVTDPDESDPATVPEVAPAPTLGEVFGQLQHLPTRLGKTPADPGAASAPAGSDTGTGSVLSMYAQYERSLRYQVFGREGELILRSANAPVLAMTQLDGLSQSTGDEGQVWRNFGVWDRHHDYRILVSENYELRNRLVRTIALHVASPLMLGLPVLIALLWFSISRGLTPLGVLAAHIEARKPDNLMQLDETSAPLEVRPLVASLNKLLYRMEHSLEGERRFTANAAHELRTPLAAIQAQVYLVRHATDALERQRALEQLQLGVERAIRLVGQMLTMARLDPQQSLPEARPVDLGAVAESVCADLAPLALQRKQHLELHVDPALPAISGNADMLSMLISNLVDNAMRYTQAGGRIEVRVLRNPEGIGLQVSDNGPGIAAALREQVFERFFRIASEGEAGTGLGLAICRRVADLHAATISISEAMQGRGARFDVAFPANCGYQKANWGLLSGGP